MLKIFISLAFIVLAPLSSAQSQTHRVIVVFDDADPDSVPADNRASVRFQRAISDALVKAGMQVLDPAVLAGGPLKSRTGQPDAKLRAAILPKTADEPVDVIQLTIYSSATPSGPSVNINVRTNFQILRFSNGLMQRAGAFEAGLPKLVDASCAAKRDCLIDEMGNALAEIAPRFVERMIEKIKR